MNLIDEKITHNVFGKGNVIDQDQSIITVQFDDEETKKFVYPDAFKNFITPEDPDTAENLKEVIAEKEQKEEELKKEREEERARQIEADQRRAKLKNYQIHESSQIVFWLDEDEQHQVFNDWQVFTGRVQSGKTKGEPNRAARLRPNSAVLLTAREKDQPESERRILGLYMVDETFSGNMSEDGIIHPHEEFRIQLTEQESEKMLFWNYYVNKNYPDRMAWNSGKYRYYDNEWTAQILKDIMALRTDEEQKKHVQNFLEYFCQLNALDIDNIPEANGALKQKASADS